MNSYVERTRPALTSVDIGIALRDYPDASYCLLNPGNSIRLLRLQQTPKLVGQRTGTQFAVVRGARVQRTSPIPALGTKIASVELHKTLRVKNGSALATPNRELAG
jgi:hypothetical protein